MNRKITFGLLSVVGICAVILPSIMGANLEGKKKDSSEKLLSRVKAPSKIMEDPSRVIKKPGFLYEDFESMHDGQFDGGWIVRATPGHPGDCWSVGSLGKGGDELAGPSGYRYAYILSDRDASETYNHDAWLFSPSVHLNGSQEYKVEFFSYLAPGLNVMEKLEVSIMDAADPDAIVATLGIVDDNEAEWKYNEYKWTPEKSGDYVIGFHSESSNQGNGTLIDDVRISSGPLSSYLGAIGVDMGETDLVADYFTSTYAVRNTGEAAMDINLIAASPEIKVKGLPCTVEPYGYKELTIEFTPKALGAYKGEFILSTSDLSHPEVPLIVISNVRDVPVRRYHLEDFEEGGPKGWKMNAGAVNTDFKGGHNGPRSFYVRSFYTLDDETEVGFTTHYCDMGDNPEFSFWYKLTDCDLMGAESGPTGPEYPIIDVFVTDDFGKTWSKVYSISPDGSTAHKPSSEFQQIKVALPAYAGKRCRAKVQLKHAGDPLINDFILLMDDVALGTQPETDLKVTSFYGGGNAQAGEKTTFHGVVTNLGKEQSGEYVVKLSDSDGKEIKALSCRPLGGGESVSFDLDWIPVDAGNYHLVASLSEPNDVNIDNNISNFLKINVANSDQSQVNVGSGQLYLSNGLPIDFTAKETKVQTIYYANELGIDSGEIASLSFWSVFDYEHLTDNFEVYIAETDRYDFDDEEIIPDSCFTKVFSGNMFLPPQEYAFTVPFEQPYKYHGGNIVLMTTKCSNEFINTKRFMVYLDEMHQRTISAKTFNAGSLSNEEDNSKEVSNVYAKVSFNLQKAPSGSVSGIVRGKEGNLLKDAKVSLDGTQRSTVSGRRGQYSLTEVSVGSRVLTASKYGYYPSLANVVEISEGSESKVDIELAPYPKVKLSGRVLTEDGQPIEGAKIVLEGYASYSTVTNGDGQYEIADIYGDTGDSYNLRIESLHFQTAWNHDLMIGKEDFHYDATLKADVQPAFNVSAVEREDGLYLNWEMPLVEFKHDNGVPETYLGWNHGHAAAAIFSTYRQKILVKQISFYLSDKNGPHTNINVFLTGLNEDGYPNASDMRYLAKNVPFVENGWTTVILEEPVEIENFALGISGTGNLGLGATSSSADYPFEKDMHFWAGDDMYNPYDFMDFSIWAEIHPMLRVYGDYLGNPDNDPLHESLGGKKARRPDMSYDIYRKDYSETTSDSHLLGSTRETEYMDATFNQLADGDKCRYGVIVRYGSEAASPVYSNVVTKGGAGVSDIHINQMDFGFNSQSGMLTIGNPELVKEIRIYSTDGRCAKVIGEVSQYVMIDGLTSGIYMISLISTDNSMVTKKVVKK